MTISVSGSLFFEFHFPLSLVELLSSLLNFKNFDPKNPATPIDTSTREWFSQPRPSTDATTEVVQINFKLPLSISEFSAEFTRTSQRAEIWYKDRSNNWMQMRDRQRVPLALNVSSSSANSWYKYTSTVYPIVAKAVQIRQTRTPDPDLTNRPYSVGLRNVLIKRNVYERNQGVQYLEDEQDVLGNVISKYIKDWDAAKAIDGNASTYWKSAPMPDPQAVVSFYMDVRSPSGVAQSMDRIYIDPIHSGSHLNVYSSLDETVAGRKLSPIQIVPDIDVNTDWRIGRGRWDISNITNVASNYQFTGAWGPQVKTNAWYGIEWTPDFNPLDGPSSTCVLLKVNSSQATAWAPEFIYDPGAGSFSLTFRKSGQSPITFTAPLTKVFTKNEPVRAVVGWAYNPNRIIIKVVNRAGEILATTSGSPTLLPDLVSFDGSLQFARFRGLLTATVLKFEDWAAGMNAFFSNPTTYVSPDPVLPDDQGNIPPSSLDNAIFSADWTQQSAGVGGVDHTEYSSKEWTPIWQNYVAEKGFLFLPQMITAKYLKFEFTNLVEEPYPIYESGIEVNYKVFPVSVQQTSTMGPRLYSGSEVGGLFGVANLNGVKSINWFSPSSVIGAISAVVGPQTEAVRIDTGPGYVTTSVPNQLDSPITKNYQAELSKKSVYRRDQIDPYILAQDKYYTVIKGEGLQKLQPYTNIPWQEIAAANPGAISRTKQLGALAVRGTDWWLFPGQQLKIPAAVMQKLTSTSTVTERRATLETRVRFTTTAVHRYEVRTLKRDAAIAYFAGVREVFPMVSSFIYGQDKEQFDFPFYTPEQWSWNGIRKTDNGPVTRADDATSYATMFFNFQTRSNFAKVQANFRDSGLLRSDALWASSSSDNLSPNASVIPSNLDGSAWLDSFAEWSDTSIAWGAPRGVVAVNLDGDRRYQGRRVLKFSRAPGAGEAGLQVLQSTNFVGGGLFRIGTVLYKPFGNNNIILVRLIRQKDGKTIYETPVEVTPQRWTDFTTELIEIPEDKPLTTPVLTGGTTSSTGSTFAAGSYSWRVVAFNSLGDSLASNSISATLVAGGSKAMSWGAVVGATGYKIFRKLGSVESYVGATVATTTLTDTGAAGTTASPSTTNTSGGDQKYKVQMVLTGDKEDELYVSDLYTEISHIRYFMQLGGASQFLHEVTDLRFKNSASVVAPKPVTQCSVRVSILSPKGFAYGVTLTPSYLQ